MLVDSDVLIDYLKGREPVQTALRDLLARGRLKTTVINQFELLAGSRQTATQSQAVADLLSALEIIGLTSKSAFIAASIRRNLLVAGADIGMADCLIAGIAVANGFGLLTRNRRHFERVPQLQVVELDILESRSGES